MQPDKRGSYLNPDLLKEIRGRSEYGAKPLEGLLDRHAKPQPKAWSRPSHPMDALGEAMGISGFEVSNLQGAAVELLTKDPYAHGALLRAYKRYLLIAKSICHEAVARVEAEEKKRHDEKASRDSIYKDKLAEWEQRVKKITDSWTDIRNTVRTRWRRLIKSMEKLVNDDPSIHTMHDDDVIFFRILSYHGYCHIKDGMIQDVMWAYLQDDIDLEMIDQMIRELESRIADGGSWKKTQVSKLETLLTSS